MSFNGWVGRRESQGWRKGDSGQREEVLGGGPPACVG